MAIDPDVREILDQIEAGFDLRFAALEDPDDSPDWAAIEARLNALESLPGIAEPDVGTRWVAKTGDNRAGGDGLTWRTAYATGKHAYGDLPSPSPWKDYRVGRIEYGGGTFVEPAWPIGKVGDNLRIVGRGTSYRNQPWGTLVTVEDSPANAGQPFLDRGNNTRADVWNHHVLLRDLTISGGAKGSTHLTVPFDGLVQFRSPGFNCKIDNVGVVNANAYGIHIAGACETLEIFTATCARLQKGYLFDGDGPTEVSGRHHPHSILISGAQFDVQKADAVDYSFIRLEGRGKSQNKQLTILSGTMESPAQGHLSFVEHVPVAGSGWNVTVMGAEGWGGGSDSRLVLEVDGAGGGCDVAMLNSRISGGDVFESAKHSVTSGLSHSIVGGYKSGEPAWVEIV